MPCAAEPRRLGRNLVPVSAYLAEDVEESGLCSLASEWQEQGDLETHVAGPDPGVLLGALQVLGQRSRIERMTAREGPKKPRT
jgi:hypothetical protein